MASITFYRSSSWVGGARACSVLIDGHKVATLRRGSRLTVDVQAGRRELTASIGTRLSGPLSVDVAASDALIVALRTSMPADGDAAARRVSVELATVDDFTDRGITLRQAVRDRPPTGYRRLRGRERIAFGISFLILITGQVIAHTISRSFGLIIQLPAMLVLLFLFARIFMYRPEK
jgi:hypothetical protein